MSQLPRVDYQRVWAIKSVMLRAIFEDLLANGLVQSGFAQFEAMASKALLDHALYESVSAVAGGPDRRAWTSGLTSRNADATSTARHEYAGEIRYRIFLQWLADQQLAAAQDRARNAGCSIGIYRDLAVGKCGAILTASRMGPRSARRRIHLRLTGRSGTCRHPIPITG